MHDDMFEALDPPLGNAREEFARLTNRLAAFISSRADYNDTGRPLITTEVQTMALAGCVLAFLRRTLPFDPSHPDHEPYVRALELHARATRFGLKTTLRDVRRSLELWASDCIAAFEADLIEGRIAEPVVLALALRAIESRGVGYTGAVHHPGFILATYDGRGGWIEDNSGRTVPLELLELWKPETIKLPNRDNRSELLEVQLPLVDMSKGPTAVRFPDSFGRALYIAAGLALPEGTPKRGPMPSVDHIARVVELEMSNEDLAPGKLERLERTNEEDIKKSRSLVRSRRDFILEKLGWKIMK